MFEFGELFMDEHLDKVNQNSGVISSVSSSSYFWSCVRVSSDSAWAYDNSGMSINRGFSYAQFAVRPVTLLKLV